MFACFISLRCVFRRKKEWFLFFESDCEKIEFLTDYQEDPYLQGIKYYYIDKQNKLAIDTAEAKDFERNEFFGQAGKYSIWSGELSSWAMKFDNAALAFQDLIFDGLSSRDGMVLFQDEKNGNRRLGCRCLFPSGCVPAFAGVASGLLADVCEYAAVDVEDVPVYEVGSV